MFSAIRRAGAYKSLDMIVGARRARAKGYTDDGRSALDHREQRGYTGMNATQDRDELRGWRMWDADVGGRACEIRWRGNATCVRERDQTTRALSVENIVTRWDEMGGREQYSSLLGVAEHHA